MITVQVQQVDVMPYCSRDSYPVFALERVTVQYFADSGELVGSSVDVLVMADGTCYCYGEFGVEFSDIDDAYSEYVVPTEDVSWFGLGGVDWHDCRCVPGRAFACELPRSEYVWEVELGQMVAAFGDELGTRNSRMRSALCELRQRRHVAWIRDHC